MQFTKNGNYCLSCGQDGALKLWNPHRPGIEGSGSGGLLVKTFGGMHQKGALDTAICDDNGKFASCGNDKTALLWDVGSAKVIRKFWDHGGRVNCVAFNSRTQGDESVLITGSYDTRVRAFDLRARNARAMQVMDSGRDSITSLVVTGHQIIASDVHGALVGWLVGWLVGCLLAWLFDQAGRRCGQRVFLSGVCVVTALSHACPGPCRPRESSCSFVSWFCFLLRLPFRPYSGCFDFKYFVRACVHACDAMLSHTGIVNYYDLRKACCLSDQLTAPVSWIALSNDGNCMLASCLDSTMQLVEAATGDHMITYKGS